MAAGAVRAGPPASRPVPGRSPSLRARAARHLLGSGVRLARRLGAGGSPQPDAPVEELFDYAVRMRRSSDRVAAVLPDPAGVEVRALEGAPVPGRWVCDPAARVRDVDDEVAATDRVVLHLHGGAYVMFSSTTHRGLAAGLSRTARAAVAVPDYRLAPEHRFPSALDDAEATYRWLVEARGVDPARVAVVGDSAGGGLAAGLLVRLRARGEPLPACLVLMSPWLDLACTGASLDERDAADPWLSAAMVRRAGRVYAGSVRLDDPELSPLYADPTGLPPVLAQVGGDEVLHDDARRFVERCRAAGVPASLGCFDGLWHGFQLFAGLPEARDALREVGGFVRRHVPGGPVAATVARAGARRR